MNHLQRAKLIAWAEGYSTARGSLEMNPLAMPAGDLQALYEDGWNAGRHINYLLTASASDLGAIEIFAALPNSRIGLK